MDKKEKRFQFTYSAKEQSELEHIRKKYLPQEENKLDLLRKLDQSVSQKAQQTALTLGIIGALILGTGMSFAMTDLGAALNLNTGLSMTIGIAVGLVGLVLVAFAYPAYNRVLHKERQRIAPEILRLTDELMK